MAKYRNALPQLNGDLFLTDGGIETNLLFNEGFELPYFASFHLLNEEKAQPAIADWMRTHCQIAKRYQVGFILESLTWRAHLDWAKKLGYTSAALVDCIHQSINMFEPYRLKYENKHTQVVFSGCVGPRGDGYVAEDKMSVNEAEEYHSLLIEALSETEADMISALTLNYVDEAIGIARAAKAYDMPVVISFTVETDGRLPTGQTLQSAIEAVESDPKSAPIYYMINCAHPTHFMEVVSGGEPWLRRLRGVRANASKCSHAELDESNLLDDGDPRELAAQYQLLRQRLPMLNVLGGCCGTDARHIEEIAKACSHNLT